METLDLYSKAVNHLPIGATPLQMWEKFSLFVSQFDSITDLRRYRTGIMKSIIVWLKQPQFLERLEAFDTSEIPRRPSSDLDSRSSLVGIELISLDMVKANFTAVALAVPEMVKYSTEYEQFFRSFLPKDGRDATWLVESRQVRHDVFKQVNPAKIAQINCWFMAREFAKTGLPEEQIIGITADEFILHRPASLEFVRNLDPRVRATVTRIDRLQVIPEVQVRRPLSTRTIRPVIVLPDGNIVEGVPSMYLRNVNKFIYPQIYRQVYLQAPIQPSDRIGSVNGFEVEFDEYTVQSRA